MGAGGGAADAREQPPPRRRRAPRGPRRLRRHRQGGPRPGQPADHQARAHAPGRRRDAARPVGQARRGLRDPRAGSARAHRQLEPRPPVGDLGALPRARRGRPDDVRPDDRGVVDLHRHPGHPPGHVRDVRRGRAQALRRHAPRPPRRDRRPRRHGRRAAARGDDERGLRAVRRGRPAPHRAPAGDALPRRARRRPRRGARAPRGGQGGRRGGLGRPPRQRRRGPAGARPPRRRGRRRHRPDERPRCRSTAMSRPG